MPADFLPGNYRCIPGVFQYSAGVAALPGYEILRVRFREPVPLARGFERVGHRITGDRIGQSNHRGVGGEFDHLSIDDASRVAFTRIMPDDKAVSATAFSL